MVNLLQVTEDHSLNNTGITTAVDAIMSQVSHRSPSIQQTLVATSPEIVPVPTGVSTHSLPPSGIGRVWCYSPHARRDLDQLISQVDLLHLHGIWMWVQWASACEARLQGKPFILSVHGMLEPWIWQRQNFLHQLKKFLYWHLVVHPVFRHASLVHAIHPREAETMKAYFERNASPPGKPEIVIIPHSLDLESTDRILGTLGPTSPAHVPGSSQDRYILFLGRLHPVKGIDLLIQAFARLGDTRSKLKIAGITQPRELAYASYLQRLVKELGLSERVEFLGTVQGTQKWQLLRDAWVFCLPSHSEVIGMVNLEAAACHTPVITTHATGLDPGWAENGGVLLDPDSTALASALDNALHWSPQERQERGSSLRHFLHKNYSWDATSEHWITAYQRLGANK